MCGIAGALRIRDQRPIDRGVIESMNESLRHRGPDSGGVHLAPGIALAARRLAILDLAGGDQPVANEAGSVWAVLNGEIYNFAALRAELEVHGHKFRSRVDTEVLVHGYEQWGTALAPRLRGMFAFAVWDSARRRLLLARDRAGEKPLFLAKGDGWLVFASEIKALLRHPDVPRRLNADAVDPFLAFHYVPDPLTLFAGIESLPPAHQLVVENGVARTTRYWQLAYEPDRSMSVGAAADGLRHHLDEAVRMQLVADVGVGAFLSGGIDSSAIVALMAKHASGPVETFSIGYASGGEAFDERAYAREVAARWGTRHHEFVMEPDLAALIPELVHAFDGPFGNASAIPMWHLARETRRFVKVALSGLGGDEVAAGYERHRGAMLAERLHPAPRRLLAALLAPLLNALPDARGGGPWMERAKRFARTAALPFDERYAALLMRSTVAHRAALLTESFRERVLRGDPAAAFRRALEPVRDADPLHRALYSDLALYLPGDLLPLSDRVTMAHGLELRVPFLDHVLLEFAARIPPEHKLRGAELKHVLRRAVADLLPPALLRRPKMGFSAPTQVWFRGPLRQYVEDTLSHEAVAAGGIFRPEAVRALLDEHFARRANHDDRIFALLTFTVWQREYGIRP